VDEPLSSDEEIAAAHVGTLDVLNAPIMLAEYDPAWPRLFEREATRIRAALRDGALLIEHVGSTAVPKLAARDRAHGAVPRSPAHRRRGSPSVRADEAHARPANVEIHTALRRCQDDGLEEILSRAAGTRPASSDIP
jgi:hypothetical protein